VLTLYRYPSGVAAPIGSSCCTRRGSTRRPAVPNVDLPSVTNAIRFGTAVSLLAPRIGLGYLSPHGAVCFTEGRVTGILRRWLRG
jgi:hypothetical protein